MDEKDRRFFEQLIEKQNEEFKKFVGVLMENTDHKIALVSESHQALHEEIKSLSRKTDERFDLVDFKIDTLNDKIDAVDEKLTKQIDAVDKKLTKKIDAVELNLTQHIDAVATDLKAHRSDTEAHNNIYRVKES